MGVASTVTGLLGMVFGGTAPRSQPRPSELYQPFFEQLPVMTGKTVVVTGASRGLGYVTALSVARKGAAVILVGRKSAKADAALAEISEASAGPSPQLVECDLLDFGSVRAAATSLREQAAEIDVLCCNAGIMMQPDEASNDGYDITMATKRAPPGAEPPLAPSAYAPCLSARRGAACSRTSC